MKLRTFRAHRKTLLLRILLAFPLAVALSVPYVASADCGDANENGSVTVLDALLVLQSSVGTSTSCDGRCDCDLDGDRELDVSDALATLRIGVGSQHGGCGTFYDWCFYDDDCEAGFYCGTDPDWDCDAACVPD
jgi:hypothetical protein